MFLCHQARYDSLKCIVFYCIIKRWLTIVVPTISLLGCFLIFWDGFYLLWCGPQGPFLGVSMFMSAFFLEALLCRLPWIFRFQTCSSGFPTFVPMVFVFRRNLDFRNSNLQTQAWRGSSLNWSCDVISRILKLGNPKSRMPNAKRWLRKLTPN